MFAFGQRRRVPRESWLGEQGKALFQDLGELIVLAVLMGAALFGPALFAPEKPGETLEQHFCIHCEAR